MKLSWSNGALGGASFSVLLAGFLGPSAPTADPVEFNRDIRPILGKCMACHGPAAEAGLAGLRLDSYKGATAVLPSGKIAIVPGKPELSELILRVNLMDERVMPPRSSHKTLSDQEKKLLHDWVAQGAEYKVHWAFVAPKRPPLPPVTNSAWPRGPIDQFVLAKMEAHGLAPEPEADRPTLIRRVSLDLTGLPPSPAEVKAFVQDRSKDAYEKVVDRLLASPRYGERMAMDWMDYSRYADSNGYQADFERFQSPWRDWVIKAFNANMPYNQFTVEQIAGDLLPNATTSQKLATAFNRNHRINTEGGVIAEEWRVENVVDRVETTSAIWLGLTSGCARCHDHKYDPFTQKDFYRMYAYFNNVPETGTGEERPVNHPPLMKAATPEQEARIAVLSKTIAAADAETQRRLQTNSAQAAKWTVKADIPSVPQGLAARIQFAPQGGSAFKLEGNASLEIGRATGSVKVGEGGFASVGTIGDFERDQPFSVGAWIRTENGTGSAFSRMDTGNAYRGWDLSLDDGRPQFHLISKWTENAAKIVTKQKIPVGRWVHVMATYDGLSKASGIRIYINGQPADMNTANDTLSGTIRTGVPTTIGRRTSGDIFTGQVDDFVLYTRVLASDEVAKLASTNPAARLLMVPESQRTPEQKTELVRLWSVANDKRFAALDASADSARREVAKIQASIPDVMVMAEMPTPRETHLLKRGMYDQPGEKVDAGLPEFLPPLPKGAPNNRLGFAEWVVSPENPLTARVTVNRLWDRFFGQGIVSTVEDFGTRAEYPSHMELLDYMATRFVELNWDLKAMVKEIVTSATYRQSSHVAAAKLEADPPNRYLSRMPRLRLPGEVIRDQALLASGLLVEKIGGPSVRPYQPPGIWDETNVYGNLRNYQHDMGPGLYRRSLYTIWKRTAAPPNMLLFDVPSREACRVRRSRTNTPLQALVLMNDETYIEAARVLAEKMLREGGATPQSRIRFAYLRVLGREPTADETRILTANLEKRIGRYRKDPMAARDLASAGEVRLDLGLDRAELAAYTVTASTLLNLDETVTRE